MGGPSLKHQVKKAGKLSEAEALGHLKGEAKFDKSSLGVKFNIRMLLENAIKKIDPLELVAVSGVTLIIKQGLDWTEIAMEKLEFLRLLMTGRGLDAIKELWETLGLIPPEEKKQVMDSTEIMQWLVSFALAYLIVHNFGEIVRGVGGILSNVQLLGFAKVLLGGLSS